MGLIEQSLVPRMASELRALANYLNLRDYGAPTNKPSPGTITTTLVGAVDVDEITWTYEQPDFLRGRRADGFVVAVEPRDDAAPATCQFLLAIGSTAFVMCWPNTQARSYAVAAFRYTHSRDLALGEFSQVAAWKNVS